MGLGKTLQSICILAGDHFLRYNPKPNPSFCFAPTALFSYHNAYVLWILCCVQGSGVQQDQGTRLLPFTLYSGVSTHPDGPLGGWGGQVLFQRVSQSSALYWTTNRTSTVLFTKYFERYVTFWTSTTSTIDTQQTCLEFNSMFYVFFRLQHQVKKHNLIVASYDVVRNDIDFFR